MTDSTEEVIKKTLSLAKSQHQNYKCSSKSELKRLCTQDQVGMAKKILELEQRVKVLTDALTRIRDEDIGPAKCVSIAYKALAQLPKESKE